ncbi:MAG: DUF4384 domain-containing protein [Endomicrobiales bacterium]|nr:DUF4384 domain-containing protein [Endomicrobiales bacterium]
MHKHISVLVSISMLFVFSARPECRTLHKDTGKTPEWFEKSIIPEDKFIYAVGHSELMDSKNEAKDEAIADATETFVKYCKVDVQSFDRSIEVYSKTGGKEFEKSDVQGRRVIRSKAFVTRAIPEDWFIRKEKGKYAASVLLKVPKEEFDRIVNEKDVKISMDIFLYYQNEKGKMKMLDEGDVMQSGGGYALYIRPSDTCYLYVFQIDSLGESFRLFPNSMYETEENPLMPSSDNWLPNEIDLFELDETTGKEHIYVFASLEPIEEFEGEKALSLTKSDIDRVIEIKKMGVKGVIKKRDTGEIKPPQQARKIAEIKKKLQSEGAFVYETWFWHK